MGATAADTQREIEEIRKDVTSAVREVKRRIARVTDLRLYARKAEEHPAAVVGAALGAAGVVAAVVMRQVVERRRRNRPSERLRRTVHGAADELGERLERAREALPMRMRMGARGDDMDLAKGGHLAENKPGMVKRLLWSGLAAGMMALGGLLARRLSAMVWRMAMREEPPTHGD
ncbi:MAG: hypothetical protein IT305_31890 [Chloroflexi bacterium]|nr:hypothetical protein [Chloroflexota bacterium]